MSLVPCPGYHTIQLHQLAIGFLFCQCHARVVNAFLLRFAGALRLGEFGLLALLDRLSTGRLLELDLLVERANDLLVFADQVTHFVVGCVHRRELGLASRPTHALVDPIGDGVGVGVIDDEEIVVAVHAQPASGSLIFGVRSPVDDEPL
ncbi:hypothetical protein B1R32_12430 [Abditibacterium utsteinense]|uniref:Uncharacterized protein n=1 Tax=Abditibacterium utsteinense TaxID=1960156 RepID=A0A2S8SPK9_9BACT|nr:hypothetical protein [Abditibacterium utsteinense]PQV62714.1 hypothetical protein B1R32_12430 [Abditibacterium utsteinense]